MPIALCWQFMIVVDKDAMSGCKSTCRISSFVMLLHSPFFCFHGDRIILWTCWNETFSKTTRFFNMLILNFSWFIFIDGDFDNENIVYRLFKAALHLENYKQTWTMESLYDSHKAIIQSLTNVHFCLCVDTTDKILLMNWYLK